MADRPDDAEPGALLITLTLVGTGALVVTSVAAAVVPDPFAAVHAALSALLFAFGSVAMLWGYARGISRSRTELVTLPGLFFLASPVAPGRVRRTFLVALAVQVVAVVAAASIRPFSEVAFGILAPVYALGMMALWGARHGDFPAGPARPGS